jgi:hypothetical protein
MADKVYTNDSMDLVVTCLNCKRPRCDNGQCILTKREDKSKSRKKLEPIPDEIISKVYEMNYYGWTKNAIAMELKIDISVVNRALITSERRAKKEGKR